MAQPFVGEIRIFAGNFAPVGWMFCSGQTLPIAENDVLFQLIGTTYGGDGQETFQLPNLQSRLPVHQGTSSFGTTYQLAQASGVENVTLMVNQIPAHRHTILGTSDLANTASPKDAYLSTTPTGSKIYSTSVVSLSALDSSNISQNGGNQSHNNVQPFLCVNFIISLFGIFPSQS